MRHRASQQAYRQQHQEQRKEYNRKHLENRKQKILKSNPISTVIDVEEISRPVKVDKGTKKGEKQALHMD